MRKVLVVEDDRFISAIFSLFLKDLGFDIIGRCKTGVEALEECVMHKPDIVLMDIHLEGDLDGIEAAERIQRECEVPVIFISSDTSSEIVERAVISNSYGYLVKPITKKELAISMELAYFRHKADLDQKRREQSFRNYISNAPIAIAIVQKGIIRYLNNQALDLFKTHYMEDIIGTALTDFVGEGFVPVLENAFANETNEVITPFHLQLKTFYQKTLNVVVFASLITFNEAPAYQLVFVEISEYLAKVEALEKWEEATLSGLGPILVINNLFEVVDYNFGFKEYVGPAFDMRGHSVFRLRPWMNIDCGALANIFNQKNKDPIDLPIETTTHILLCSCYVLNNKDGDPEKILVVLKKTVKKNELEN